MILENLLNRMKGSTDHIKLSNDTLITLSQIESGCLFIKHSGKTLMIIKSTEDEIENLKDLKKISLTPELIEKPEFPAIAAYIRIHTKNKNSHDFEYYFSIEASEELELVENLCIQKNVEIVFYDEAIMHSKLVRLNEEDISLMTSMLGHAKQLFDKA